MKVLSSSSPSWHWRPHLFVLCGLLFCPTVICWVQPERLEKWLQCKRELLDCGLQSSMALDLKMPIHPNLPKIFSHLPPLVLLCFIYPSFRYLPLTYLFLQYSMLNQAMAWCTRKHVLPQWRITVLIWGQGQAVVTSVLKLYLHCKILDWQHNF